jgi:hypothetical protein
MAITSMQGESTDRAATVIHEDQSCSPTAHKANGEIDARAANRLFGNYGSVAASINNQRSIGIPLRGPHTVTSER